MIDVIEYKNRYIYASKEINELDEFAEYLEEIFPDAQIKKARWDKEVKLNLLEVDIGDDITKKDLKDLIKQNCITGSTANPKNEKG